MAQLEKGRTFNPGDTVEAGDLNNLVDIATAMGGLVFDQPAATPVVGDSIVFYDVSASAPDRLRRCTITTLGNLIGAVTTFSAGNLTGVFTTHVDTPGSTPHLTFNMVAAGTNKFLASPADGSTGDLAVRAMVPKDITITPRAIDAFAIDWSLAHVFTKTLRDGAGDDPFTFANVANGQTIKVSLIQNSTAGHRTASWTSVGHTLVWRDGGTPPVVTATNGARDLFTFTRIGTLIYGYADQNFLV